MKCRHVCAAKNAYKLFTKLYLKPDFPSLADGIAKPRPDMNIKVAAFTVSEKSISTIIDFDEGDMRIYLHEKRFIFEYHF